MAQPGGCSGSCSGGPNTGCCSSSVSSSISSGGCSNGIGNDKQRRSASALGGHNNNGSSSTKPRGRQRLQMQQEQAKRKQRREEEAAQQQQYSTSSILLIIILLVWLLAIGSMVLIPESQALLTYLHWIKWPLFRNLKDLISFRLPYARNIQVHTADGVVLGGWHLLPTHQLAAEASQHDHDSDGRDQLFDQLLGQPNARIVLYFHGNAATRGQYNRLELVKSLSSTLGAHVIAVDYRGFADSTGWPSEKGLLNDAKATWQWVQQRVFKGVNATSSNVYIYGHSLGSGVAVKLAAYLSSQEKGGEGEKDKGIATGVILDAPFTNLTTAALHHPSALPFRIIPFVRYILIRSMRESYPSINLISSITCPILICHGRNDRMIPFHLGRELYQAAKLARIRYYPHMLEDVWFSEFSTASHNDIYAYPQWVNDLHQFMVTMERKDEP